MKAEPFDLKLLLGHFREVGEISSRMILDTDFLESIFSPVKEGREPLSADLVERLKEDFAFPSYWRLPHIGDAELEGLSKAFNTMTVQDEKVIWQLFEIIKNIEIVSCILRFIDPQKYAIFSPPVENLLNIRGKDPVEKYINYLCDLNQIGEVYGFVRIADVDHALWTLANIINSDRLRNKPPYNEIYGEYKSHPNVIKTITAKNSLAQVWSENAPYLDLARIFLEEDPLLAGLIASREFEFLIKELCKRNGVKLSFKTVNGIYWMYIPDLAKQLRIKRAINHDEEGKANQYWQMRNLLVHGASIPDEKLETVGEMISWLDEIGKSHGIEQRATLRNRELETRR